MTAKDVIAMLGLQPHPEGGHFRETFRDEKGEGARAFSTAIYYLLRAGEVSRWHRVDAAEVWHWYPGAPLALAQSADGVGISTETLGNDISAGQKPQPAASAQTWQSARSLGAWTLVGCTVAPGFVFDGFELATPGWEPGA
jgi:predicted cupin superfamily sugar epimerase